MIFLSFEWGLPLKNPILVFSIVLFVILFSQIALRKFKIPSILGPILAGLILGPHGTHVLERNSAIELFGTVGLLYIMFIAGLELDLNEFKKTKYRSGSFGLLTFIFPLIIGYIACYYIFGYSGLSSLLIASMFSTHTLVAYPIVSRLGVNRNVAVTITVGGTIITDTLVLLNLAFITGLHEGKTGLNYWLGFGGGVLAFVAFVVIAFPYIARWFFKNVKGENSSQYIFILGLVFLAAFAAELAGIEAIIGAFLAGLVLNKLIPHTSSLMNRIEFVGNAFFIPFFLLRVGMLVNLSVLLEGFTAIVLAISLTVIAIGGKYIAAYITQKLFKYSINQRNLIFGLSSAHAAATIAVILVGFNIGILDEKVLNATIILILITCLVSSFIVENAAKKLAISESELVPHKENDVEKILIPISNPKTIELLMDFAIMLKDPLSKEPLLPLTVVENNEEATQRILSGRKMLEKATVYASSSENKTEIITRVDLNVAHGISLSIKELMVTDVVIGWGAKFNPIDKIFGSTIDEVVNNSWDQYLFVSKLSNPLNTYKSINLLLPSNIHCEKHFATAVSKILRISKAMSVKLVIYGSELTKNLVENIIKEKKQSVESEFRNLKDLEDFIISSKKIAPEDFIILLSARKGSISHDSILDNMPSKLSKHFPESDFVICYPKQSDGQSECANIGPGN